MNLVEVVGNLRKIDDRLKAKFTRMAAIYEDDLEKNIVKSHFELAKVTKIPHDDWAAFLRITEVSAWINEAMHMMATAGERKLISQMGSAGVDTKEVNALKALKDYNKNSKTEDNSHIVIMYIQPDEED